MSTNAATSTAAPATITTSTTVASGVKIVGHRGWGSTAVAGVEENTLASFRQTVDGGADGLETDVNLTKDGVLVLYHDEKLRGRPIGSYTFEEIRAVPIGAGGEHRIATLHELLELVAAAGKSAEDFVLVLELKGSCFAEARNVELLASWLVSRRMGGLVAKVSSFDTGVVRSAAAAFSARDELAHVRVSKLIGRDSTLLPGPLMDSARQCGAHELHLRYSHASRSLVEAAALAGVGLMFYFPTMDESEEDLRFVLDAGATCVCTNKPATLRLLLGSRAAAIPAA